MAPVKNAAEQAAEPMAQVAQGATLSGPALEELAPKVQEMVGGFDTFKGEIEGAKESLSGFDTSIDTAKTAMDSFGSAMAAIPPKVDAALVGAASTAGQAIATAAQGLADALRNAATSIKNAASASGSTTKAETKYDGKGGKMMPLAAAIAKERQMMPAGANLVIANSSETVIPAFAGHMGDGFKNLSFEEMESAAGFNRMKTYTEQIGEIADKTAASFAMGGALGGGSATLAAMEALGHANGLMTTSGHRPGDPGFHGVNRARDLSNGSGETPEMNKVANIMATQFGSSLTELIYTPLGYSIKNGAKTGLISPDNHYHHIHVAVAEGLAKAAVFNSEKAAYNYEKANMPAGSEPMKVNLASMTANSSEFGGGGDIHVGDINVNVQGVDDQQSNCKPTSQKRIMFCDREDNLRRSIHKLNNGPKERLLQPYVTKVMWGRSWTCRHPITPTADEHHRIVLAQNISFSSTRRRTSDAPHL